MRFLSVAFSIHRFLGTLISLLFLMWFISGLILIYHPFPYVQKQEIYARKTPLPRHLPSIDSICQKIKKIGSGTKIYQFQGQTLLRLETNKETNTFHINGEKIKRPDILEIAKKWVASPIEKIDTLKEREQWIMYSRYERVMPIYKIYFDDLQQHQLYIAAKTGEVQQFTNRKQRTWAWLGAIPHKLYFPFLRKHTQVWINSLTILGTIAFIAVFFGIYIGVKLFYRTYKKKGKIGSPFRKRWSLWHHITGIIFGIFLLGWAFSGAIALQRVPQWLVATKHNYKINRKTIQGPPLSIAKYIADYRKIVKQYPDTKEIEWSHFQDIPIYKVIVGDKIFYLDASNSELLPLSLSSKSVSKLVSKIFGDTALYSIELMNTYDNYYLSLKHHKPLPVYKVSIADSDNSVLYIDPKSGVFRYVNDNRRTKKWMFSALHYFNIRFFAHNHTLWTVVMWTLCIGGIIVSGSGVYLSGKYLRRKMRRFKRRIKSNIH